MSQSRFFRSCFARTKSEKKQEMGGMRVLDGFLTSTCWLLHSPCLLVSMYVALFCAVLNIREIWIFDGGLS